MRNSLRESFRRFRGCRIHEKLRKVALREASGGEMPRLRDEVLPVQNRGCLASRRGATWRGVLNPGRRGLSKCFCSLSPPLSLSFSFCVKPCCRVNLWSKIWGFLSQYLVQVSLQYLVQDFAYFPQFYVVFCACSKSQIVSRGAKLVLFLSKIVGMSKMSSSESNCILVFAFYVGERQTENTQ